MPRLEIFVVDDCPQGPFPPQISTQQQQQLEEELEYYICYNHYKYYKL